MRLIIGLSLAIALVAFGEPASAAMRTEVRGGNGLNAGDANISGHQESDGNDTIRAPRRGGGGADKPPDWITCGVSTGAEFEAAATPSCDNLAPGQQAFAVLITPNPNVPAPTFDEVLAVVRDYIRTLSMPVPQPQISAPEGITGARHSLDLRTQNARTFPLEDTAFGNLRATAHGTFTVNWGDGKTNTYTTTGAPWPNSNISHAWSKTGSYDINVTGNWSLDWSLGGYSGVITGLTTNGSIADFPVIEAQAVLIH